MILVFASLRGNDFEIEMSEGSSVEEAWQALAEREEENGTLWRCSDEYRNQWACDNDGFTMHGNVAYKIIM